MSNSEYLKTLKYWHLQEFLLPQSLAEPKKINGKTVSSKAFKGNCEEVVLWINDCKNKSYGDYYWEFTLYSGIYKLELIKDILLDLFEVKSDVEERPQFGNGATFLVKIDKDLRFKENSFQLSTSPWAIKEFKRDNLDLEYKEFNKVLSFVQDKFNNNYSTQVINENMLDTLFEYINRETLKNSIDVQDKIYQVIAIRKKKKKSESSKDELDMLNSFYIEDLDKGIKLLNSSNTDNLLFKYLNKSIDKKENERVDLRENINYVYERLAPNNFPDACWPSVGNHPLVFSQQFAVNSMYKRLLTKSDLYAVNGPPGTGKTTMLRDIVAMIITQRAKELILISNGNNVFFSNRKNIWKNNEFQKSYYELPSNLLGFEIVVASSNNGAVENVTLEIPAKKSVEKDWCEQIDFFKEFGDQIIGGESWGNSAACLGNSQNKSNFISKFWYSEKDEKGNIIFEGFQEYLQNIEKVDSKELEKKWVNARAEFTSALKEVQKLKEMKTSIKELPSVIKKQIENLNNQLESCNDKILNLNSEIKSLRNNYELNFNNHEELEKDHNRLETNRDDFLSYIKKETTNLEDKDNEIESHKFKKPGLIEIIIDFLFSKAKRIKQWNNDLIELEDNNRTIKATINNTRKSLSSVEKDILNCIRKIEDLKNILLKIKENIIELTKKNDRFKSDLEEIKIKTEKRKEEYKVALKKRYEEEKRTVKEEEREKSSPWMDSEFQYARAEVFVKALNLHKVFIDLNAKQIRTNLLSLIDVLSGNVSTNSEFKSAIPHLWATLFLCIPVISTTFASFGRLFSHFDNKEIGWLLIDEAGQASSSAAVGAIIRSKRCVAVGDPLQLEPIIGLSTTIQDTLRKINKAPPSSLSQYTSVQKQFDFSEYYGTYLDSSNDGEGIWVGSPLRVHRRCLSPMFDISNVTTYSNMMVQAKKDDKSSLLPKSQWIDVNSSKNNGHWIEEEGDRVKELIIDFKNLGLEKDDIFIISPFRDVVNGLKDKFEHSDLIDRDKIGTIHTVQGKESKVVFLVLGSNPENEGARIWASSKPNLLNVAATRAKERFYIVGNKSKWKDKHYFKDAISLMS